MSKRSKEKPDAAAPPAPASELAALVAEGDNRAARHRARQLLSAPSASDADRAAARDILDRTGLERAALFTAAAAIAVIAAIAVLVYLR